jgi:Ca-activated chloride channel family protein
MKRILLASVLMFCATPLAVGQFAERTSEPGTPDELRGLKNIYVTSFGRDQSVQKKVIEAIKKRLPHLNVVSSPMAADVWLKLTFEFRYDQYRVPNANESSAQTASDVLYTANGKLFRVKPDRRLSLIKEFRRQGPDQKALGADFAKEFVKTYEKANTGPAPAPTVPLSQTIASTEKPTAIQQRQDESRTAVQSHPKTDEGGIPLQSQPITDEIEVLRVDTHLVTINASVLDRDARYVSTLSKDSFSVYDEGVKQELAFFAAVEEPFSVALLIDTSGSVRRTFKDIIAAANSFVAQLRPHDNVMVVAFDSDIRELIKTIRSSDVKGRGISLEIGGGKHTLVYDAVAFTIRQRLNRMGGRKAIILLTDGISADGESTYERSISDAEEAGTLVYAIQFEPYKEAMKHFMKPSVKASELAKKEFQEYKMAHEKAEAYLEELARKTGGRSFKADVVKDFSDAFASIIKELSSQYSLGYYPQPLPKHGERRRIKVAVDLPNVGVRARGDYIFTTPERLQPLSPNRKE